MLHDKVFPQLRDYCYSHGVRFQVVDLRWGVSEEDAVDHRTIQICLEEIKRCQRLSPQPNFLILLGDRYGWQPLPAEIPANEFELILDYYIKGNFSHESTLLKNWYQLDKNAVPSVYYLKSRYGKYLTYDIWLQTEERIRIILQEAINNLRFSQKQKEKYILSATGQEILLGALRPPAGVMDPTAHVFGFFRTISMSSKIEKKAAEIYFDWRVNGDYDLSSRKKLAHLKNLLKRRLQGNIYSYRVKWSNGSISNCYLEKLRDELQNALLLVIKRQLTEQEQLSHLERECRINQEFLTERIAAFTGRSDLSKKANIYICNANYKPLIFYGPGGCGKSSLMAKVIDDNIEKLPASVIIYRFIGITPASSSEFYLLDSLSQQIAQAYEISDYKPATSLDEACDLFQKYLTLSTSDRSLLLVLDGLDQLSGYDDAFELKWLPTKLPANTNLIVSAVRGKVVKALRKKYPTSCFTKVTPMDQVEGGKLLDNWLNHTNRTLQEWQRDEVLKCFAREGSPLFLKLAFELSKKWRSNERRTLPQSLDKLIYRVCTELEKQHGKVITRQCLNYLTASRLGLSEDEMIDLLSRDKDVMSEYARLYSHSPETGNKIPFIVWARIYADLDAYLVERDTEGNILLNFFHRRFGSSIKSVYLTFQQRRGCHTQLAQYYLDQKPYMDLDGNIVNQRIIAELPFQLMAADMNNELVAIMSDPIFMKSKIEGGKKFELIDEMLLTYERVKEHDLMVQSLTEALFNFLKRSGGAENKTLSVEEIHSALIYRPSTDYYEHFLQFGMAQKSRDTSDLSLACAIRMANLKRRMGDLDGVEQVYNAIVSHLDKLISKERSRLQYDIGYTKYLRGKYDEAILYLQQSEESSGENTDPVGFWISKCVEYFVSLQASILTDNFQNALDTFDQILSEALTVFIQFERENTNAHRWIMNVYAHRFKIAYYRNDQITARKQYSLLENYPWVKNNNPREFMLPIRARLNLIGSRTTSRYFDEIYKKYYKDKAAEEISRESAGEDYYDYGRALVKTGKIERAQEIWHEGLLIPDEPGNHKWKKLIRASLQELI